MNTPKWLLASLSTAIAMFVGTAHPAQAEPLTPLTPNEVHYLDQLRQVLTISGDPAAFRSDGRLLDAGRYACQKSNIGIVGQSATLLPPAITQLAFIYLCPK